ncbi:FtsX-like permease family protein [Vagococcus sp. BWB3-3]|uniref:FtsX-like permease family protein n=1 Tax=Vagococcus allomyrinae TaxID=2794353 RepID=A0A940P9D0_9ENTE|nr:FtsX-like permease family protein [Vagococcus allomyrinae]MBP1040337.1 FtsX-like permease family protein [Vagococcus allomyrinae]
MNRNDNRSVIKLLARRGNQGKASRNVVAILAIALTTMMFTTVFSIGFSMLDSLAQLGIAASSSTQGLLIAIMVILSILVSGYLIISNIFEASVTQDIQYYGLLKTIGTTKTQIGRLIRQQGISLCRKGIPLGLVAGFVISMVVVPLVLVSFEAKHVLSLNPLIFIGAALFAILTVLIATNKPAKLAGKVSPMQALAYVTDETKQQASAKKSTKTLTPKIMAKNNLERNKKLNFRVILSITLGFTLMNTFYVYQNSFDQDAYVDAFIGSDLAMQVTDNQQALPKSLVDMNLKGVVTGGDVYYTEQSAVLNSDVKTRLLNYYQQEGPRSWLESTEAAMTQYDQLKATGRTDVGIFGADQFTASMGKIFFGELAAEQFQKGNYVIAFALADNGEGSLHYDVGDQIELAGKSYELMAVMEPKATLLDIGRSAFVSESNGLDIHYMISAANFKQDFPEGKRISTFANTKNTSTRKKLQKELSQSYPDYHVSSQESFQARFQSQVLAQVILGYTLGIIMAVIGILNFVNAMLTAIITRKREFAVLESIGMTKKQLKEMLIHEGLTYGSKAIVLSLLLSIVVANSWVANSVSDSWVAAYHFSLAPFLVIIPLMLCLAYQIPMICFKETQKKSLVTRLRETN